MNLRRQTIKCFVMVALSPDIAYAVMESDLRDRPSLGIYWSYDASMPLNSELAE